MSFNGARWSDEQIREFELAHPEFGEPEIDDSELPDLYLWLREQEIGQFIIEKFGTEASIDFATLILETFSTCDCEQGK